jgi:hypothetical protein
VRSRTCYFAGLKIVWSRGIGMRRYYFTLRGGLMVMIGHHALMVYRRPSWDKGGRS